MKLSIVVPCYNSEKYLNECLKSLSSQSCDDYEVILVDDGSTDSTPEICDSFAANDSRIHVIHQKNAGCIAARRSGLEIVTGDYCCFADSDDWVSEDFVADYCKAAEEYNADILSFGLFRCVGDDRIAKPDEIKPGIYRGETLTWLKQNAIYYADKPFFHYGIKPSLCVKAFKTEIIKKAIKNVDSSISQGEDFSCTFPCVFAAESIYISEKSNYFYRDNPVSITYHFDKGVFNALNCLLLHIENSIDQSEYDAKNQICAYSVYKTDLLFKRALKSNLSKKEIIRLLISDIPVDLFARIKNAKIKNISLKKRVSIMFVRHRILTRLAILFFG